MANLHRYRANARAFAEVVSALVDGPHTVRELCEVSGLHENTVSKVIGALKNMRLVYVHDWSEDRRGIRSRREWAFDPTRRKRDKPSPARTHRAEICARYEERKRQRRIDAAILF